MKNTIKALLISALFLAIPTIQAGRGGAIAGGFFAGALTGALLSNAAYNSDYAYYDTPVYDRYYPESTRYGVYDYPAYSYYPGYAYAVDMPAYVYPAGYEYAYS